jgi:hypothetical protein
MGERDEEDERNEFRSTMRSVFAPFDEHRAVWVYRRNLPHWRQDGATYFVTFRLHDSIPKAVFREWEFEKQKWRSMRGIPCGAEDDWKRLLRRLSDRDQELFHEYFNRLFHVTLDKGRGESYLKRGNCLTKVRTICSSWINRLATSATSL